MPRQSSDYPLEEERGRAVPTIPGKEVKQKIVAFEQDEDGDWRAVLACGHRQHVRHNPPLVSRPWVQTEAGRNQFLGYELECKLCDDETA